MLSQIKAIFEELAQILDQISVLKCLTQVGCQTVAKLAKRRPKCLNKLGFVSEQLLDCKCES